MSLTDTEAALMGRLIEAGEEGVHSRLLALDVLRYAVADKSSDQNVRQHVVNIRRKLGYDAIETTRWGHLGVYRIGGYASPVQIAQTPEGKRPLHEERPKRVEIPKYADIWKVRERILS